MPRRGARGSNRRYRHDSLTIVEGVGGELLFAARLTDLGDGYITIEEVITITGLALDSQIHRPDVTVPGP